MTVAELKMRYIEDFMVTPRGQAVFRGVDGVGG